jgi:single-strand DNA-binding protein
MSLFWCSGEGTLVADPELAFGPSGTPWIRFRLATNERTRDSTGGWTDGPPTFINVVMFGKPAENLAESVVMGDSLIVTGTLEQQEYVTKEGEQRTTYRIKAESVGPAMRFHPARTDRVIAAQSTTVRDPWA